MPNPSPIPGPKVLLMGPAGTGKTYSTRTLFNIEGLEPIHFFFEPSMSTISAIKESKWAYLNPYGKAVDWDVLAQVGRHINTLGNKELQEAGVGNKRDFTQWLEMIALFNSFKTKQGEDLGDVMKWGTDRVLVIDGMTGMNRMARGLSAGMRPLLTQPDYGVIMFNLQTMFEYLTSQVWCTLILIAHIEKEKDEISGGYVTTVASVGRKLPPVIPPLFDDVILSIRKGDQFSWSVAEAADETQTKNRTLPLRNDLEQDWAILFDAWKENGGTFGPHPEADNDNSG